MTVEKRFYWWKMKEDFCENPKLLWLEEEQNGIEMIWFYIKLCCKTLKNNGKLYEKLGDNFVNYPPNILGKMTSTDVKLVKKSVEIFMKYGLISNDGDGSYLPEVSDNIGSETQSASRVRRFREKAKAGEVSVTDANLCNADVTPTCNADVTPVKQNCNGEIEIEKEIEIDIDKKEKSKKKKSTPYHDQNGVPKIFFTEKVSLTQKEYDKLVDRYGKEGADEHIEILDSYKGCGRNGKTITYDCDYKVCLGWVHTEYLKRHRSNPQTANDVAEQALKIMRGGKDGTANGSSGEWNTISVRAEVT